jgi:lipid A 3-O-deacylase
MKFVFAAALLSLAAPALYAGQELAAPSKESKAVIFDPFEKGNHEFQLGVSYNFSFNTGTDIRPDVGDADLHLRMGWMLTSPAGDGCFRGNWEFLAEVFGGAVVDGPGDVIAGLTFLLRYNFVQPDSKWVPYFQIGVGGAYSDISDDPVQRLVGSDFSFNLQAGLGIRYMTSERMAVYLEATVRHLSNANQAERNLGLNTVGAQVGVSWFW